MSSTGNRYSNEFKQQLVELFQSGQSVYEYKDIVKLAVQRLMSNKELQEIDDQFSQRYDLLIQEYTQLIHQ
jgi:hypothetical protein